jgi:hypothetical protein
MTVGREPCLIRFTYSAADPKGPKGRFVPFSQSFWDVWEFSPNQTTAKELEPPKGTVFNYPVRPSHRGEANTPGYPAPPDIAVQIYQRGIYPTMLAKRQSGQSIPQVIAWAKDELEGFIR